MWQKGLPRQLAGRAGLRLQRQAKHIAPDLRQRRQGIKARIGRPVRRFQHARGRDGVGWQVMQRDPCGGILSGVAGRMNQPTVVACVEPRRFQRIVSREHGSVVGEGAGGLQVEPDCKPCRPKQRQCQQQRWRADDQRQPQRRASVSCAFARFASMTPANNARDRSHAASWTSRLNYWASCQASRPSQSPRAARAACSIQLSRLGGTIDIGIGEDLRQPHQARGPRFGRRR